MGGVGVRVKVGLGAWVRCWWGVGGGWRGFGRGWGGLGWASDSVWDGVGVAAGEMEAEGGVGEKLGHLGINSVVLEGIWVRVGGGAGVGVGVGMGVGLGLWFGMRLGWGRRVNGNP